MVDFSKPTSRGDVLRNNTVQDKSILGSLLRKVIFYSINSIISFFSQKPMPVKGSAFLVRWAVEMWMPQVSGNHVVLQAEQWREGRQLDGLHLMKYYRVKDVQYSWLSFTYGLVSWFWLQQKRPHGLCLSWQCFLSEQTMPLVIKPQEMKMNRIGGKEWDLLAVVSRDLGQSHQRGAEAVITT